MSQRPYYLLACIQRWLNVVLDLLIATLAVILIALATSLRSSANPGRLGVSLTTIMVFNQTLQELFDSWIGLETSLGAIARTRSFELKTPPEHQAEENSKSTLLSALLCLVDNTTGTISIDGIDIATIPRNVLCSRLIAIPQDPLTIIGTVRFNLDPKGVGPDVSSPLWKRSIYLDSLSLTGAWAQN
ncbi:uncharacterized protein BDW43DRAFT_316092 [Aspergillus alliaceus]|uniref:uncharacterized protein n=1 Tax=Petromyces alliaceus TaxID=209559 RepID=UPI0012A4966E|nr:uncharacterized protein BDW43DRAFT_316092 [Aspergillus alliaceus]KAB8228239.1 hypothetical protein BDW43DRAFT_316092 [Aspergillus alliaceus]